VSPRAQQSIKRFTDPIASGVFLADEKLQELRDKRDRLIGDLQSFNEKKTIVDDVLKAVEYINRDLENALWLLAVEKLGIIARILRHIFKRQSSVVESYWDREMPRASSVP
jgi:hypothetical protein